MLAHEAAEQLELASVILVPTGEAPHKRISPEPGPTARLELARAAAADDELLEVSDLEVATKGPSYTANTLADVRERRPADELWFLMGSDVAASLPSWHEPEAVAAIARLGIATRPGSKLDAVRAALEELRASDRADFVEMPEIGISSSMIRARVAAGRTIRYLVPPAVAEAIEERRLYREAVPA